MRRTACILAVLLVLAGCTPPGITPDPPPITGSAAFPCPAFTAASTASTPAVRSGRVQVGRVSYPSAPAPFGAADTGEYLPFANLVGSQRAVVEATSATSMGWESVIALGRLSSVDGAWGAEQAAEVVAQCSLSQVWRGIDYHPSVGRDEAVQVDGHRGWLRVTELSFRVPGVKTTSETQTVVVIRVDDETYAYLSYLPGSAPDLKPLLDATREDLQVD